MKKRPMTYEQIFAGRMLLMRTQRHISQVEWDGKSPGLNPQFKTAGGEEAFFTVERLLIELESEFDSKKNKLSKPRQKIWDARADRQVIQ